ncbi:hypothetical protein DITRI_Ditri19aG0044900 [Diplodiscus trichospermus]
MDKTFNFDIKTQQARCVTFADKLWLFLFIVFIYLLVFSYGEDDHTTNHNKVTKIGAIIDVDSRIGREEKTAIEIAVQARKLIKEKEVKVIIGMETWEEAVLVADIGSRAQVPVLSLAAPAITPPLAASRWPFLVRMANGDSEQMKCIAAIISSFSWKRIIVIYEDDALGGDSGKLALLSEALKNVSSEIDYPLVLPPYSSLSNPNKVVQDALMKLLNIQSRVFIVLQSSLPMTVHLFEKAQKIGLVERDSAWIVTDTVTSYLDSFNSSVISSMEGTLGIKTYYSEDSSLYKKIYPEFRKAFRNGYQDEDDFQPGINALRAYDSIGVITQAMKKLKNAENRSTPSLKNIISSSFTGLSGQIRFEEGQLSHDPILRIVNVVGKKYKELDFWLPGIGFSRNHVKKNESGYVGDISVELACRVTWPAGLNRVPKGWAMPTNITPMIIGVPARTSFEKIVNVADGKYPGQKSYGGFYIELFKEVVKVLNCDLPFQFEPHIGTCDELVHKFYNKIYDAAVGDITILAERTDYVEFTQPYAESGLAMIVPAKSESSAWMFLKPFTPAMWLVTGAILIYTMFIVWSLEHHSNPEFRGPWNNQIATALWFTFSSLFFAHRENIHSNLTRVVVVIWLFVVSIINSSYTASLASMLTEQRLEPNITDIEWLKRANMKIGCDGDSFVRTYLQDVIGFKSHNIVNVCSEYSCEGELQSNHIAAAFLERPYEKVFLNHYYKQFTSATPTFRFGGLGFAFQKGSPIAADVSRAILRLSEDGTLKSLEEKWFAPSPQCSTNVTNSSTDSLSIDPQLRGSFPYFWGHIHRELYPVDESVGIKAIRVAKYLYHGEIRISGEASASPALQAPDINGWSSSLLDYQSPTHTEMQSLELTSQAQNVN